MKRILLAIAAAAALVAGAAHAQLNVNSGAVTVAQATTDEVITIKPGNAKRLAATVIVATNSLDAFQINLKFNSADATFHTVYDTAAEFTSPAGLLVGADGDLTTAATGNHWFILDTQGVYEVQIKASSSAAGGSSVTIHGVLQ